MKNIFKFLLSTLVLTTAACAQSQLPTCPDMQIPSSGSTQWDVPLNANFNNLTSAWENGCVTDFFNTNSFAVGNSPRITSSIGTGPLVLRDSPTLNSPNLKSPTADTLIVSQKIVLTGTGTIQASATGNTDLNGTFALSSGSGSYTFQNLYSTAPMCFVFDVTAHSVPSWTTSTTTLSVTGTGTDTVQYFCLGGKPLTNLPTTNLALQIGNNSSSCSAIGTPAYCNIALPDYQTNASNAAAQTIHLTPVGHVSQMKMATYLYAGATTQFIAAYQPWFNPGTCFNGGGESNALHPCVGYNENDASVIAAQHSAMIARGFSVVSPDWYGTSASQSFINQTVLDEGADLAARCVGSVCPLKMMVMIDKGLLTSGMSGTAGCPAGSADETSCILTSLEAAYDYIDSHWGRQNYYSTDATSGQPITLTFLDESAWSGTNWATVWSTLKSYMSKYATPYKIVKEFGNFSENNIDGAYGWPQPLVYSSTNQLCWYSVTCSTDYFNSLYTQGQAAGGKITMGMIYAGFDGSNNNYNNNVIARQCGQVLVFSANRIWSTGSGFTAYSSTNQLPWVIVPTWNDYGEGTNIEDGISNCYTISGSVSSNTLNWTLSKTDTTYASTTTIDHFTVWYADASNNLFLAQDNIPSGTTSLNISSLIPSGTWTVYVEMVGKPLILNQMSNGSTYTH